MGVFSYQVISPTRRLLIDTTMNEATAKANEGKHFDTAAFARVVAAMNEVETIIVTHEHFDHLGGLAAQPNLSALLAKTKLTAEQVGSLPDSIKPGTWPAAGLQGYPPLVTGALFALAPGVVLIKSPGHTPGSQMVYVQRADGVEYLFIGDVAWSKENIDRVRGRAGLVSQFFLKEDRAAVIRQLAQLHRLSQAEPSVHIVPGHDLATIEALKNGLLLADHFVQPRP